MDNRQLLSYWQTLAEAADPDENKVYEELIGKLSNQEKTQAAYWDIYHSEACQIGTPVWQFMLAHLPELRANNGTEKVDRFLAGNYMDKLEEYILGYNNERTVPFETLARDIPTLGVAQQENLNRMLELADLVYYKKVKELAKLIKKGMPDMSLPETHQKRDAGHEPAGIANLRLRFPGHGLGLGRRRSPAQGICQDRQAAGGTRPHPHGGASRQPLHQRFRAL